MRILVAYGSKRGGTAGLAEMIGEGLETAGLGAVVQPARRAPGPEGFDAVVVAGALYANRWHRDARRYVHRHAGCLRALPVWLVASGPLGESASGGDIPPVRHVAGAMSHVHARGQVTFGGRLEADAKGFPARAMAKKMAGDWRDREQVDLWASMIALELTHPDGSPSQGSAREEPPVT
ncbi:MAG TPA: flavodoxin domain-containing protein [Acidimicrobiales bacterium]|nr:flavodoxin domain-containing protein [Acidimicrobiales bacterium]